MTRLETYEREYNLIKPFDSALRNSRLLQFIASERACVTILFCHERFF